MVASRAVTIEFMVDEGQPFGLWNNMYAKFDDNGGFSIVDAKAVADAYLLAGVRLPDEFAKPREILNERIAKLQAVL